MKNELIEFLQIQDISGVLVDLGIVKYELTYCPGTGLTSLMAPLWRSLQTSDSRALDAKREILGLQGVILCCGAQPFQ